MGWIDDERRQRIEQARKPSGAGEAIEVLKGLGWTSKNFADVAYGLDLEERTYPPLRKGRRTK